MGKFTPSGDPVYVPRMSPDLYKRISEECQSKLDSLFERVVIPRDAPAKKDYGDIDFLVGGIKSTASPSTIAASIRSLLGAELCVDHSYGIPHPEVPDAYVQVDVELAPGDDTPDAAELFEWTRFMKGDSDLLQIIGILHRSLGITCNDQGLHVRVEQIEPYNRKKALLFLTRDPDKAMDFLGLDVAKHKAGFKNETEVFDWTTGGRFFSPSIFAERIEKSNDRSRQAKRPMYRHFVETYMPAHLDCSSKVWSREEVLHEALDHFEKHEEFEIMMDEHRTKEAEEQFWKEVCEVLPVDGNSLNTVLRSLKRWVAFQDGEPHIVTEAILEGAAPWTKCVAPDKKQDILSWIEEHWREVKALEKKRVAAAKEAAKRRE